MEASHKTHRPHIKVEKDAEEEKIARMTLTHSVNSRQNGGMNA